MTTTRVQDWQTLSGYIKKPGMRPLPGYVLLEPLGRGGFGEVWKCEVPGGLLKAVKFVLGTDELTNDDNKLRQELEAFQQVKAIRHPYLLCLERVELVGNELVMVMALADRQLGDRFLECQQAGLPGIPREELLGYLLEAAEALDVISTQHGLQHLDVKPANLFLTAGHVQVGDYGLVSKHDVGSGGGKTRGLTPKYAAPEVLRGQIHTQSDQYSLALVYFELLTGKFPYTGKNSQQIILQHASAVPDLSSLPEGDRGPVATALAKVPGNRFPSCRAFVKALVNIPIDGRYESNSSSATGSGVNRYPAAPAHRFSGAINQNAAARESTPVNETTPAPQLTERSPTQVRVPKLVGINRTPPRPSAPEVILPPPPPPPARQPQQQSDVSTVVRLKQILSVIPVGWLRGREADDPDLLPNDLVRAVMATATRGKAISTNPAGVMRVSDDRWECRFLTTIDPRVAKVKLDLLSDHGRLTKESPDESLVIFRRNASTPSPSSSGFALFAKKPSPAPAGGFEIVVELPKPGIPIGVVSASGRFFGSPSREFLESSEGKIVAILEEIRTQLNNYQDRRKHPRIPTDLRITIFPLHPDYRVDVPVNGVCENCSAGGLAFRIASPLPTKHAYIAFEGVRGITGLAILFQVIRANREEDGVKVAGRYRIDLLGAK